VFQQFSHLFGPFPEASLAAPLVNQCQPAFLFSQVKLSQNQLSRRLFLELVVNQKTAHKSGKLMHLQQIRLSRSIQEILRCPICHAKLKQLEEQFKCTNSQCASHFPIVDGIPVLINEKSSVFSIDDYTSQLATTGNISENKLKRAIRSLIPTINRNIKGKSNYIRMRQTLLRQSASPRVLVVGGRILGQGMDALANNPIIDLVESDVSLGPRTKLICDAHDIPFENESFDGVVAQAVLEHVVDPYRCCEEIHRVLKKQGLVYAETPFMYQVHGGCYDFTRFTHLGHRRLFRRFEEIDSGAVCGPGMALALSYQYFLMSFTTHRILRGALRDFASLTSFYLKYLDYFLINKQGSLDAASGYYFMGRRAERVLSDRDLVKLYRGAG
jgi:uncharacterized protein YbaR (Trm112 family)